MKHNRGMIAGILALILAFGSEAVPPGPTILTPPKRAQTRSHPAKKEVYRQLDFNNKG